ncbi:hypothetical protein HYV72_00310, partial [Candidatus Uhrbacteria bacterium]|nr:hypothetical protein [Candidatus Uhrbacteria bacterium]
MSTSAMYLSSVAGICASASDAHDFLDARKHPDSCVIRLGFFQRDLAEFAVERNKGRQQFMQQLEDGDTAFIEGFERGADAHRDRRTIGRAPRVSMRMSFRMDGQGREQGTHLFTIVALIAHVLRQHDRLRFFGRSCATVSARKTALCQFTPPCFEREVVRGDFLQRMNSSHGDILAQYIGTSKRLPGTTTLIATLYISHQERLKKDMTSKSIS